MHRRFALLTTALLLVGCGGGAPSRLHTLSKPAGGGGIDFQVENRTTTIVNNLFLAESTRIRNAPREALEPGHPEQALLWGNDLLPRSGLEPGGKLPVAVPKSGRYDVRAVGRDGREQHIGGLRLVPGGRYVLELEEGSWRAPR